MYEVSNHIKQPQITRITSTGPDEVCEGHLRLFDTRVI